MTVVNLLFVFLVSMGLNGAFLALAFHYWLRGRQSGTRLRLARTEAQQLVAGIQNVLAADAIHKPLPRRNDPLEAMFKAPAVLPAHEHGRTSGEHQ
jgi:hypothetical protein